jgi:hypothetical protein
MAEQDGSSNNASELFGMYVCWISADTHYPDWRLLMVLFSSSKHILAQDTEISYGHSHSSSFKFSECNPLLSLNAT